MILLKGNWNLINRRLTIVNRESVIGNSFVIFRLHHNNVINRSQKTQRIAEFYPLRLYAFAFKKYVYYVNVGCLIVNIMYKDS